MPWNFRAYGSAVDPIHKSHLNQIVGDYGCPRYFQYEMDARADRGDAAPDERDTVSGKAAAGTAAHETIARALTKPELVERLLAGPANVKRDQIESVFRAELAREVGHRTAQWYRDDEAEVIDERVHMIHGLLNELHKYVAEIVLVEAGFVAPLDRYWLSGHVDLVYKPKARPDTIAICDWKTGASKPGSVELDHGWEAGVYSTAVRQGTFVPRSMIKCTSEADGRTIARCGQHVVTHWSKYIAEREALERTLVDIAKAVETNIGDPYGSMEDVADALKADAAFHFGEFPTEIWHVHLADYVPYRKAGNKAVKRPEDLRFYGYEHPEPKHRYVAGDLRGPAWLPVQLTEYDMPRLQARLRKIVGMVRMGHFVDQTGDRCTRCSHMRECLTWGYSPVGDEKKRLERSLRGRHDGDELSVDDE